MAAKIYYIITGFTLFELEHNVNAAIEGDGAIPQGGVFTTWQWGRKLGVGKASYVKRYGFRRIFCQAMVDWPQMPPPKEEDSN